jgi:hypothetical protein
MIFARHLSFIIGVIISLFGQFFNMVAHHHEDKRNGLTDFYKNSIYNRLVSCLDVLKLLDKMTV